MKFTRPRDLVIAGLLAAVVLYLIMQSAYGSLPPLPTLAGVTLIIIAVIDVVLGFSLRSRIRRTKPGKPVEALTAARAVALAKASSVLGAIMLGAWIGVLIYVFLKRGDIVAASNDTTSAIIGAVCSAALIAAGLWLENCLKTPDEPKEPDDR
ncbi:DUF3180 domain-containing protein [Kibdelosporangium philippinense]|uniref:DUF3180 domain-containing protein n=1 Tax=Kibdelosporangium philippinense TaxID=211113 RepID=A0ABS8ZNU4_9PSEU|nr:DUF3180 domain-containing protein [Kibdelosporangium philippinense]MCE7009234.1 DUF3180 domain-containing protein [Kibdelosporangium philippinense]